MQGRYIDRELIGRPKAMLRNPNFPGLAWIGHQPKYSYYGAQANKALSQANGAIQTLFTVPTSGPYTLVGATATFNFSAWHTNLDGNGRLLPSPQRLYVKMIRAYQYVETAAADAISFAQIALVNFFIGNNVSYLNAHFRSLPAGYGPMGASTGITNMGLPLIQNACNFWSPSYRIGTGGAPSQPAVSTTDPATGQPITTRNVEIIEQNEQFGVVIDPTQFHDAAGNTSYTTSAGGIGINAWIELDGLWMRQVQ